MPSVEFSDSYRIAALGYPTNYVRIDYTEVQYDAANNRTQVRLDGVYIKYTGGNANSRCFGTLKFNGTTVLTMDGTPYTITVGNSYSYVNSSANGATVWVQHNSPSGTASLSVSLTGGTRNDDNDDVFGALYYNGSGYPVIGVRTPETKSASLTTRTSTLTVNPNGGTWNGSTASQSFSQAPTSTRTVANPSRTGYTFKGWTLSGGGSLSGTTYTYGGSSGTLIAQWEINTYTISFDANGGEDAPESQTKIYGQTLILSTDIPTRTGCSFKEWNTKADGSGVPYSSGGNYTANEAAILYAIWELFNYTLSITQSAQGVTTNILRTSSPIGQAPTGAITNGATLYYNDEISIGYTIGGAYQLLTATVNNIDISEETLPYVVTVNSNVVISITAKLGAIVYIGNEAYQAFIGNGTDWVQCQAYIGNGSSWDTY